jgi:hypothetical protein
MMINMSFIISYGSFCLIYKMVTNLRMIYYYYIYFFYNVETFLKKSHLDVPLTSSKTYG